MSERGKKVFESRALATHQLMEIEAIKAQAEALWDLIDEIQAQPNNNYSSEIGRLVTLAKTDLESAVMWANKAISRENP